jgi:hypothetical protein
MHPVEAAEPIASFDMDLEPGDRHICDVPTTTVVRSQLISSSDPPGEGQYVTCLKKIAIRNILMFWHLKNKAKVT